MNKYKGKNIRVSNECHDGLVEHLPGKVIMGKWVEEAIEEKKERERKTEKVQYDENGKLKN